MANLSKRRTKQYREYSKVRKEYLEEHSYCEVCYSPATEIHHKKGKIESLLTDKNFFLAVCRNCHDWIENNPEKAKEEGYSVDRL